MHQVAIHDEQPEPGSSDSLFASHSLCGTHEEDRWTKVERLIGPCLDSALSRVTPWTSLMRKEVRQAQGTKWDACDQSG